MNFRKMHIMLTTALLAFNLNTRAQDKKFDLSFESAPVEQVAGYYGDLVDRTVILNPGVKANLTLKGRNLTKDEVMQAIETVLQMNNVSLVPVGEKFLKVVVANSARKEGAPVEILTDLASLDATDKIVTRIIGLNNIGIQEAQTALQTLMGRNGSIQTFEKSNSLMITDSSLNLKRMLEILEYIDQPATKVEPHIYELEYAEASDIAQKLTELVEIAQSQSTTSSASSSGRQNPSGVIRARSSSSNTSVPGSPQSSDAIGSSANMIEGFVKITSDERTNILIIFTKESNFGFFDKIISVLDVPVEPDVLIEVVSLEYAEAEDISALLSSLISGVSSSGKDKNSADKSAEKNGQKTSASPKPTTGTQTTVSQFSDKAKVLSDDRTNSLLLMGSKSDISSLKSMIEKLDVMLAQVMIETVVLEVELGDSTETGVQWLQQNVDGSSVYNTGWNNSDDLSDVSSTSTNIFSASSLASYIYIGGIDMTSVISLSKNTSKVNILQTPIIMTTDNTEATITIAEERPVVTSTGTSSSGNDYSSYDYVDIGISLTVTPHINPQNFVVMDIEQNADEVGEDVIIDDNEVPTILNREMSASVAVHDRSTIVLGGLVKTEERETVSKIPLLGDIPLLGKLFSDSSTENDRSELLVLITPYVLSTPEEAEKNSARVHKASAASDMIWPAGWSESPLKNEETGRPTKEAEEIMRQLSE